MNFLEEIEKILPNRSTQILKLYNLYKFEPYPDAVHLWGHSSSGKTSIVKAVLSKLNIEFIEVNLIECYSTKILLETIVKKMIGTHLKCENVFEFVEYFRQHPPTKSIVFICDKAERLNNMDCNILPSLLYLRELTDCVNISIIFLSEISWQRINSKTNWRNPIKIAFPQYTKTELQEILALTANNSLFEQRPSQQDFNRNYYHIFLSVFYRTCRDLSELRYVSRDNLTKHAEPLISRKTDDSNSLALWNEIMPTLKDQMKFLYLRIPKEQIDDTKNIQLPFYAKYLLIAAYLASYSSSKNDKALYIKHKTNKNKSVRVKKNPEIQSTLVGPKSFSFDRLLAIFYSILNEKISLNDNFLIQISSLMKLHLIYSVSDASFDLENPTYICGINYEFVQSLSKMVGVNIRKYLND